MADSPDRDLVDDFAQEVLAELAPEELAIFPETAAEFHADPDKVLSASGRDEAVGFGLELALITPIVLAVAKPVLEFLLDTVSAAAKEEAKPALQDLVRRLFKRKKQGPAEQKGTAEKEPQPVQLSAAEATKVREVALARAKDLGLPIEKARLLADAVIGGLNVATT